MLKKAITIILALAMMSGTSVFASNETEESNNATQIEQNSEVTAFESDISRAVSLGIINNENYNFNDDITREQFCNFVYNLVNPIKELPYSNMNVLHLMTQTAMTKLPYYIPLK